MRRRASATPPICYRICASLPARPPHFLLPLPLDLHPASRLRSIIFLIHNLCLLLVVTLRTSYWLCLLASPSLSPWAAPSLSLALSCKCSLRPALHRLACE